MAFSNQVNLKSYMNKASKNNINRPKSVDEAHNVKEALSHKKGMSNVTGRVGTSNNYVSSSGAILRANPNSKVKKNPVKKTKAVPKG